MFDARQTGFYLRQRFSTQTALRRELCTRLEKKVWQDLNFKNLKNIIIKNRFFLFYRVAQISKSDCVRATTLLSTRREHQHQHQQRRQRQRRLQRVPAIQRVRLPQPTAAAVVVVARQSHLASTIINSSKCNLVREPLRKPGPEWPIGVGKLVGKRLLRLSWFLRKLNNLQEAIL